MSPGVTVIVPVRNGAAHVGEALASVIAQLENGDEVLVVDDQSTDGTRAVLEGFASRIRVLEGPGRGPSAARNVGLAEARKGLIAFLDHDDLWPPGRLDALRRAFADADDGKMATQGRVHIIAEDGPVPAAYAAMHGAYLDWQVMTMLCPTALVRDTGGFAEDMIYGEDIDLGLRLIEAGMRLQRIEAVTWLHRRHAGNASNAAIAAQRGQAEAMRRRLRRGRMVS